MEDIQTKLQVYEPILEDLMKRLYVLTIFFVVVFLASFFCSTWVIRFFTTYFDFAGVVYAATSPYQLLDLVMSISMFLAMTCTIPVFLYQLYAFVCTGLRRGERKMFLFIIPLGIALFAAGFAYSFFISYLTMQTIADINTSLGVQNLWDIDMFLSQIISTSTLLGFIFEFPIVLTVLVKTGLMTVTMLQENRRVVVFSICACTALLPPTDGLSLIAMLVPLIALYEATILYNKVEQVSTETLLN